MSTLTEYPHVAFATRLKMACDSSTHVPPDNFGRLRWIADELAKEGVSVTREGVRKWMAGITRPRQKALIALSKILSVDSTWMSDGVKPGMTPFEQRRFAVATRGAATMVASWIQMAGWNVAFPDPDDEEAALQKIEFYAIIRGAKYSIHVALGTSEGDPMFTVPPEAKDLLVLGVVRDKGFSVRIYELEMSKVIEIGAKKATGLEVKLSDHNWREITSFEDRI